MHCKSVENMENLLTPEILVQIGNGILQFKQENAELEFILELTNHKIFLALPSTEFKNIWVKVKQIFNLI